MSEAKHTPGPWNILKVVGGGVKPTHLVYINIGPNERTCAVSVYGDLNQSGENAKRTIPEAECRANARLIAAAPELLAACRRAKDLLVPEVTKEPDRTIFWELVAAIAKADGREPYAVRG